ncbi:MAG TPA: 4Fe-4S dicluster domain-containing protein, partial [Anaerolineae bacterium]|nr:4Fe-4S dicluster domain-containing protein [Anaerolineae bacterium]
AILDSTPRAGNEIVKANWQGQARGNFDDAWRETLSNGVMANTALPRRTVALKLDWIGNAPQELPLQSYEVVFQPDPTIYDGRFANNAWLQELPKPFTKLTWDNVIAVSPAAAQRLGLNTTIAATGGEHGQVEADVVQISYQGQTVRAPVWILPGLADDQVILSAGYGRSKAGSVGTNVGFNSYTMRTSRSMWFGAGLEMTKSNERVPLATTQFHATMEGRDLVQHTTLQEFSQNPNFAQHREENVSLYPPPNMQGEQWGMAIDLNSCIGCNACVIACQAENNIPSVGKEEVLRAREMHWLRIDRYEQGVGANLQTYFEPIPCMHCEYAPCEPVCPVAATTHSPDGLNEMTYNRCIGTRYCSNNCPYKVRRFNFFQYQDWDVPNKTGVTAVLVNATTPMKGPAIAAMHNPDVTVRSRGVMEKCTYCVQRIHRARIAAEKENRAIRDGEILTACQAACPTEAIIFGNINDPTSRVAQLKANSRNYALLDELNTRPRTTYLAVVRNPNPEIT